MYGSFFVFCVWLSFFSVCVTQWQSAFLINSDPFFHHRQESQVRQFAFPPHTYTWRRLSAQPDVLVNKVCPFAAAARRRHSGRRCSGGVHPGPRFVPPDAGVRKLEQSAHARGILHTYIPTTFLCVYIVRIAVLSCTLVIRIYIKKNMYDTTATSKFILRFALWEVNTSS